MLGLYLHIPFCSAICNYCNFNRGLFDADLKRRYVGAMVEEISWGLQASGSRLQAELADATGPKPEVRSPKPYRSSADTIYFGGGTPSLLEADEVRRLIDACRASFLVAADSEITLEVNPETVTLERLAAFRDAGVNRISFGVQSFRDEELKRLSRLHGAARAKDAFAEARQAGFDNISLDLMMWLPGQSVDQWLTSVHGAIALGPDHLSLYLLEVYPNAPLRDEMARAQWSQAPEDDAAAMYVAAMEELERAGLEQYEISNVAREGRRARHNLKYWTDGEWIGFGCGAHSTCGGLRWKNVASTEEYVERIGRGVSAAVETRPLTDAERLGDALFMGLRLTDGVDLAAVGGRYETDIWGRYGPDLAPLVEDGLVVRDGTALRLTRRGMLLANEVMAVFV